QNWQARAAAHGLTPEAAGKLQKSERQATAAMPEAPTILRGLTENASTFTNRDIWRAAATEAQGRGWNADDIGKYVNHVMHNAECVRLRGPGGQIRYTTREMQKLEQNMA